MIPLYGFLQGDTLGLLLFAHEEDTVARLADVLQRSARLRVGHRARVKVVHEGRTLDPATAISALTPLRCLPQLCRTTARP